MRAIPLLAVAVGLTGCGDLVRPVCVESSRVEVDDVEVTSLGFSTESVLEWAVGQHVASGAYEDDTTVDVTVDVARGDGAAEIVEMVEGEHRTPGKGGLFGDSYLDIAAVCPGPTLNVPVEATVVTNDGLVDIAITATASTTDGTELGASVDIQADDMEGLPLPEGTISDGPCESADPDEAYVTVRTAPDGSTSGSAGWSGEVECSDDSTAAWSREYLGWGE